jgi:hypothetical protein
LLFLQYNQTSHKIIPVTYYMLKVVPKFIAWYEKLLQFGKINIEFKQFD